MPELGGGDLGGGHLSGGLVLFYLCCPALRPALGLQRHIPFVPLHLDGLTHCKHPQAYACPY